MERSPKLPVPPNLLLGFVVLGQSPWPPICETVLYHMALPLSHIPVPGLGVLICHMGVSASPHDGNDTRSTLNQAWRTVEAFRMPPVPQQGHMGQPDAWGSRAPRQRHRESISFPSSTIIFLEPRGLPPALYHPWSI